MKRIINALDTYFFGTDHSEGEFVPTHIQITYYGFMAVGLLFGAVLLYANLT